jgi:hypothetical protein
MALLAAASVLACCSAIVVGLGGCGDKRHNLVELELERADLASVARQLLESEGTIESEVQASKGAWPFLYRGLKAPALGTSAALVTRADRAAQKLPALPMISELHTLTGSAFGIGVLYEAFWSLTRRGWSAIAAARSAVQIESVAIYIQSVYDGHYDLSLIGKELLDGYEKLGGEAVFKHLTLAEMEAMAHFYSPEAARLEPRPAANLRK